jgi:nitrate/TMAO reductase-like tetraheme cytochrome c subunit
MTKEEIELMKDVHNFTDEDISEAAKFVETKSSSEEEYKDPCKNCHKGICEQCDYGYISEEEKKKRWVERHKKEPKLSDPYEDGGL